MKTFVWVTTTFVGFHRYKDAPEEVAFLRNWHRHTFHVKLGVRVGTLNREVEFFMLKTKLDSFIAINYGTGVGRFEESCEMIANKIISHFQGAICSVSEDKENGATVVHEGQWLTTDDLWLKQMERPTEEQVQKAVAGIRSGVMSVRAATKKTVPPEQQNTRDKPFVGYDAEGPNRGKLLLFFPGSTKPLDAVDAIRTADREFQHPQNTIEGVYYGAGNDLAFDPETFDVLCTYFSSNQIIVECDSVTKEIYDATEETTVTLVSRTPRDALADYIKTYDADTVTWTDTKTKQQYTCRLDDPLFSKDKYL